MTDPTRRQFLQGAGLTALASSVAACQATGPGGPRNRPNILFLVADQHRFDVAGFEGDAHAHTPSLDRLAAESARVTDVYCQVPLCAPARQSMLTGQYAHTHGTFRNKDEYTFHEEQVTLAHALSAAGYRTALFGKTHCNTGGFEHLRPLDRMLAEYREEHPGADRPGSSLFTFDKSDPDYDHLTMMNPGYARAGKAPTFFMEEAVAREAGEYVARDDDRPFFVWASFVNPHSPLFPPDAFYDLYAGRELPIFRSMTQDEPGLLGIHAWRRRRQGLDRVDDEQLQNITRAYYACLAWTDHCVGQLVDSLDAAGRRRDTIVIYTSDHGEMLGQHGLLKKWAFYEAAARVPLLVRWPGRIRPAVHRRVVQHIDLTATVLDWAGASMTGGEGVSGRSMADLLRGRGDWDDLAIAELPGDGFLAWMVREGPHKYMWHGSGGVGLYDLAEDPNEERNLAWHASSAERVDALRARFDEVTGRTVWNVQPRT
jgi:choline-sulfatase